MRACVALLFLAAASCARPDPLARAIAADAGPSAVDCGTVDRKASDPQIAERADTCVAEAFARHEPFRVRYLDQGPRSPFQSARAGSPSGAIYFYSFDGRAGRVTRFTCNKPELEQHGDHRHLVCMSCLECSASTPR